METITEKNIVFSGKLNTQEFKESPILEMDEETVKSIDFSKSKKNINKKKYYIARKKKEGQNEELLDKEEEITKPKELLDKKEEKSNKSTQTDNKPVLINFKDENCISYLPISSILFVKADEEIKAYNEINLILENGYEGQIINIAWTANYSTKLLKLNIKTRLFDGFSSNGKYETICVLNPHYTRDKDLFIKNTDHSALFVYDEITGWCSL